MKPTKLTLITIILLATLTISAGAILLLSVSAQVKGNAAWEPKYYTWSTTPADPWNAEVWLAGGHKAQTEINATTILLEGLYAPSGPTYNSTHGGRLVIPFVGWDVRAAVGAKIPVDHLGYMIPGRYRVTLDITGQLYTGESFIADGVIVVTVNPPPPP